MNKNIILAGAFLFFFLSPFFFHPDIKTIFYLSQFLFQGVFNIYGFISQNSDKAFLGPFVYPPLTYFLFGIFFIPIKILAGSGFVEWLAMGNSAVDVPHIFRFLFLLKLPLVLTHILTGVFLAKLIKDQAKQKIVLFLWFFNPVSIYVVSMMGQFDGIPALFTVLSLYYFSKKPYLSVGTLGIAGALKSYPLLLLPFIAFLGAKSYRKRIALFLLGIVPYVLTLIPFLGTRALYQDTLVSNLSQRIFEANIYLGFGERLLIIPFLIIIIFLFCLYDLKTSRQDPLKYFLAIPLIIVALSHFHPQWMMWSLPFLVLAVARYKMYLPFVFLIFGWIGTVVLFDDAFLTWGILSPFDPGVFFLPPLTFLLKSVFDPLLLQSIMHTIFAVSSLWIIYSSFFPKINHEV